MSSNKQSTLLLLRHAKSAWPDVPDHDRPLARRGKRDAPLMGRWLHMAGYDPDLVVCSSARRATQTWKRMQSALESAPSATFTDRVYEATAVKLLDVIRSAPATVRVLLVVGHDPGLPSLACSLVAATREAEVSEGKQAVLADGDRMRAKFPTAAIAAFDVIGRWAEFAPGAARLACFVTPHDLQTVQAAGGENGYPGTVSAGGGARLNPRKCRQRSLYR